MKKLYSLFLILLIASTIALSASATTIRTTPSLTADTTEIVVKKDYITSRESLVSVTSNRIVLGNADTTAQSRTNETIYSTPEYIPSNDEYLNATQIEYDVEDAPAFEEIAPYLISEGETYIDATTIRNNTMAELHRSSEMSIAEHM